MRDQALASVGGRLKLPGVEKHMFTVGKGLRVYLLIQLRRSFILVDANPFKIGLEAFFHEAAQVCWQNAARLGLLADAFFQFCFRFKTCSQGVVGLHSQGFIIQRSKFCFWLQHSLRRGA